MNFTLPDFAQNFITLLLAICVEAFPFVIIGVSISTVVEVWVKDKWIKKLIPKNRILAHFVPALLGFIIPVCECGNVPVVRKMMQKGFSVSQSITFLLAAPIVNPIVWITTAEAFSYDRNIAHLRVFWGFIIAMFLGLLFSYKSNQERWLNPEFEKSCHLETHNHSEQDHHGHSHSHSHNHHHQSKLTKAFELFQLEVWQVLKMLLAGAVIAASIQVFVPRQNIIEIGQNPILSVVCMLVLAFVVSMCSNVDAFFALSLSNSFSVGSLMTFLVFGPMIDIKVLSMLRKTFTPRFLLLLVILVSILSMIAGFSTNIIYHSS
jgi:uncharacterized protein